MEKISAPAALGCTCFQIRKLARTVTRLYDRHLAQAGLTTVQFSLLQNIGRAPLPLSELAARMSTERTTLTRNLRQLVEAGWVEMLPGSDSRQKIPQLTAAGRAQAKAARAAWRAAQDELERTLGMDTVGLLHAQLAHALSRLTPLLEETSHANAAE